MAQVSYTEFRAQLATHLDQVERDRTELVITRQNRPDMVVMPLTELESLRETMHLLSTPDNAKRLLDGIAELEAGAGTERGLIEP